MSTNNCLISFGISSCICLFCLLVACLPLIQSKNYDKSLCHIHRVDYPITLPIINNDNNWVTCDCGKYCTARYPCVKLYTEHSTTYIIDELSNDNSPCTFYEADCPNGEDIITTQHDLQNAIETAEKYINTTIDCYEPKTADYKNNNGTEVTDKGFFIDIDIDYDIIFTFMALYIFVFLIFTLYIFDKYMPKKNKKNKKEEIFIELNSKQLP